MTKLGIRGGKSGMDRQIPDILSDNELARLLAVPNVTTPSGLRTRITLELMANAGLRSKEVLGLRTTDVREANGQMLLHLQITKGDRVRRVPLAPDTANWLRLWLDRRRQLGITSRTVICTVSEGNRQARFSRTSELKPGKPLNARYLRALVARCGQQAGIDRRVHPHLLRHCYASRLLRHCRNLRVVQSALGHASINTTQIYTHVVAEELAEAMVSLPTLTQEAGGDEHPRE
jgi:site-specific recombinase XerD